MKDRTAIKWLMKVSAKVKWKLITLMLMNVFFAMLTVMFAFAVKAVIDGAVAKETTRLTWGGISLGIIVVLQFVFRVLINGLTEHVKCRLDVELRSKIFSEILSKSYGKITGYHSGELINRLTADINVVTDGITSIVPTFVSAFSRLILAVVALIYLDWIFAVAFVVAGALVFLVISLMREKLKKLHKSSQETEGRYRSFMQESIENLLAVKAFSANDKVVGRADEMQEENFKIKMRRRNYSVIGHATYNMIFSAGYLFALIYGAVQIFSGVMGYGALMAILQLINNVQVPFASISNVIPKYYAMLASAERVIELEKVEDEGSFNYVDATSTYENLYSINFENVAFGYDGENVISDMNVCIRKGEFIAITGASGIGKSTMIKLLLGVYPIDSGSLSLQLKSGEKQSIGKESRSLFSFVPQGNMLLSGSIRDNLTFFVGKRTDEQIEQALKISQADGFISELKDGIDTIVGEKGLGLSEGQIQRLAIARAILSDAPIMLLDEATSALDEQVEASLLTELKKLNDKTVIIITHKKQALNVCDGQITFENGKVYQR
ncbi:MAG: ABC transporter ATP-binding protein [Clostridiales bacterium]|nr:ABC transporter ATP-binding protein [Clostridiales bacterium]